MSDKAFDLVVKMIESNKEDADKRLDSIEMKLDEILQFKWQIIGGSFAMSTFIALAIQIGSFFFKAN